MENRFTSVFAIDIKQSTSHYVSDTDMILSLVENSIGSNAMNQILLNELRSWIVSFCNDIIDQISELPTCSDDNNTILSNISIFILYLINGDVGYRMLEKIYHIKKRHFGEYSLHALFSRLRHATYIVCISHENLKEATNMMRDIDRGLKRLEESNVDTREIKFCYHTIDSALDIHNGMPITAFNKLKALVYEVFDPNSLNKSLPFYLSHYDKSNMGILFSSYCYYNNVDINSGEFHMLSSIVDYIKSIFGETFPHAVMTSTYHALILVKGGRLSEAEEILSKNLNYARIYLGYDNTFCAYVQSCKCVVDITKKEYNKAKSELIEIIHHYEKFRYLIIVVKFTLAKVLALQGDFLEAESVIRSAIEFSQSAKTQAWKEIVPGSSVEE